MNGLFLAIALLFAFAGPGHARQNADFVQIKTGEQVAPSPAYILFRLLKNPLSASLSPAFLRIPTDEELARYDRAKESAFDKARPGLEKARAASLERRARAEQSGQQFDHAVPPPPSIDLFGFEYEDEQNLFALNRGNIFQRDGDDTIYLIAVRPGRYLIYGLAWGPGLHECFCFGTVGFDARAGAVTDLGAFVQDRADKVSAVPELTAETGLGETGQSDMRLFSAAIRKVPTFSVLPPSLAGLKVDPARYEAVGAFVEPGAILAQRLAPIPGVLGYRNGRAVDLRTGELATSHH